MQVSSLTTFAGSAEPLQAPRAERSAGAVLEWHDLGACIV
jgi:hypothetical protein